MKWLVFLFHATDLFGFDLSLDLELVLGALDFLLYALDGLEVFHCLDVKLCRQSKHPIRFLVRVSFTCCSILIGHNQSPRVEL